MSMDLEHRVKLALEDKSPLVVYNSCILFNDAVIRNPSGFSAQEVAKERTRIHDTFVKYWFKKVIEKTFGKEVSVDLEEPPFQFALLATGGYGRDELNPNSDIDLKLILDQPTLEGNALIKNAAEEAHYKFEEEYGFPIELGFHTLSDLGELSGAGLNTLLDIRQLSGDSKLTEKIRETLNLTYDPAELFLHNLQEYTKLSKNHGNLDDFSEFNVKNGAGGLRVFHIGRYLDSLPARVYNTEERINHGPFSLNTQQARTNIPENIERAFTTLLKVRSWLNTKRKNDKLNKKERDTIYPEDFNSLSIGMRQALATARHTIASYFEQTRRRKLENGLQIPFGEYSFVLTTEGINHARKEIENAKKQNEKGYRLLHLAQERQISLHPNAIEQLSQLTPSPLFIEGLKIEQSYTEIARILHSNGTLSRIIPGFEKLYGILTEDLSKSPITLAGRTLQRLEHLEKLIEGRELTTDDRATLRFASLIADIPITPISNDNSFKLNLKTSNPLLEYPGLESKSSELKSERVEDTHFLLSERNILVEKALERLSDDATIGEIAETCENVRRVELLNLFTNADICGKRELPNYTRHNIEELVKKTKERLSGETNTQIGKGILSPDGEQIYEDLGPDFHSSRYAGKQLPTWISILERVRETGKPIVKIFNTHWPLFGVASHNYNGLLASLIGTFYTEKVNLRQAHAYTLSKSGLILDFFETENIDEKREREIVKKLTENALSLKYPEINPQIILQPLNGKATIKYHKPAGHYVLEYKSNNDSLGILYALTHTLTENLQASIWGMRAHPRLNGLVEDRVFFTLPKKEDEREVEKIFKDATGII